VGSAKPEADRPARMPLRVAEQLAAVYGSRLEQVAYIPALPLVAKLRLGESTGDMRYAETVNALVAPFLRGDLPAPPAARLPAHQATEALSPRTAPAGRPPVPRG
jgi:hypothetical protein